MDGTCFYAWRISFVHLVNIFSESGGIIAYYRAFSTRKQIIVERVPGLLVCVQWQGAPKLSVQLGLIFLFELIYDRLVLLLMFSRYATESLEFKSKVCRRALKWI
jgi:hypothetical protein